MATAQDIPLLIVSENSASERRISPSWTIAQLKGRLEPVTGVPATCQKLSLKIGSQAAQPIEAADEESTILAAWPLQAYAELKVGITDHFFFSCLVALSVLRYVARYIRVRGGDITSKSYDRRRREHMPCGRHHRRHDPDYARQHGTWGQHQRSNRFILPVNPSHLHQSLSSRYHIDADHTTNHRSLIPALRALARTTPTPRPWRNTI